MKISKSIITRTVAFFTLLSFLSGCQLFTAAGKKLNEYCPGLNVKINGVGWSGHDSGSVFILQYDRDFQKKVNVYFADKTNGFAGDNSRSYLDIKDGQDNAIADGDSILTKTINKGKRKATVIYNATTRKIIIIEDSN